MTVHVIGGGLAGLAAAVACVSRGLAVQVHEAAPRLGGRCTSWFDRDLDAVIDNGAHAVVPGNRHVMDYLERIGSAATLTADPSRAIRLFDLGSRRFVSALSGLGLPDMAAALRLATARGGPTALDNLGAERRTIATFWQPFCTAVLNTALADADARLLSRVLRRMFFSPRSHLPLLAAESLAATFITPAEGFLRARGAEISLSSAIVALDVHDQRVAALRTRDGAIAVGPTDAVVLALPPWAPLLADLGLAAPGLAPSPIVNAHFRTADAEGVSFHGLIGGTAQWLLRRGAIVTVTVSAADDLVAAADGDIADCLWRDVAAVLGAGDRAMPPYKVVKERRATLRQTPAVQALRAGGAATRWPNAVLAGDWVTPDLPCSIDAAVASGFAAARAVLRPGGCA